MDDRLKRLNRWNNRCPKCGSDIYFSLRSGKLGATATARCALHLESSRSFDAAALKEKRVVLCSWEGLAVRMWDGSVRFKEQNGLYLFEV